MCFWWRRKSGPRTRPPTTSSLWVSISAYLSHSTLYLYTYTTHTLYLLYLIHTIHYYIYIPHTYPIHTQTKPTCTAPGPTTLASCAVTSWVPSSKSSTMELTQKTQRTTMLTPVRTINTMLTYYCIVFCLVFFYTNYSLLQGLLLLLLLPPLLLLLQVLLLLLLL